MAVGFLVFLFVISVDFSQAKITRDTLRKHVHETDEHFNDSTLIKNSATEEMLTEIESNTIETTMNSEMNQTKNNTHVFENNETQTNKMEISSGDTELITEQSQTVDEGSGNGNEELSYSVFRSDSLQVGIQQLNGSVSINYNFSKDKPDLIQCHVINKGNERFIKTVISLINCGNLPKIPNGKFIFVPGNSPEDIVSKVVCDRYYIHMGESSGGLRCQDGVWHHNAMCEIVKCSRDLKAPLNGQEISNTGYTVNSTITFSCLYSYEMIGNNTLVCAEDGQWTGIFPSCHLVKCPSPLKPEHGVIEGDIQDTVYNTTLVFRCMKGYTLIGKSIITCQADGRWNREIPECKPVCLIPTIKGLFKPLWLFPLMKALDDSAEIQYGQQVIYSCRKRFRNAYDGAVTCINGSWVPDIYCIRFYVCVNPNTPKHAMIVRQIGRSFVQYDCKEGYQISNTDNRVCRKGAWSRPVPECVKSCKIPKIFAMKEAELDFRYIQTEERSLYEIFLQYSCKNSFKKFNETQPKCIDSEWNPTPRCVSSIVRLSYTYGESIGVAEIFTDGTWGGVCDHFYFGVGRWDKTESKVFCRMLGFKKGSKLRSYTSLGVQAKFTGVACTGNEVNILQCRTKQANVFCNELVVVSCQGKKDAD
ncbi:sushi, von Willebrand factor type A, EGF and pentraxin domain-containing protein 1-like [Argonauta hians]